MDRSEHVKKVHEWVEDNKQRFSTPKKIMIDEIEFDWKYFSGSFSLKLDEIRIKERYSLSLEIDGRYNYSGPMFISPMGAPASFEAISLTKETDAAIKKAINQLFPRMAAFGLHPVSQKFINSSTPINERILDQVATEKLKQLIQTGEAKIEVLVN